MLILPRGISPGGELDPSSFPPNGSFTFAEQDKFTLLSGALQGFFFRNSFREVKGTFCKVFIV